ncbi:hypothetical protein [Paenibacillus pini]|uniref:Uncharacterized protein n=1 Tax=Paenibacillus pini JCM 16418 TaxID=1236976 RepID=W7YF63_9BACL|nr:hypothetical protein [Paenibacillus pini]GAF07127.1 hypothetical protein JCM16418_1117 [Paenibacillus pini JCM 16418]
MIVYDVIVDGEVKETIKPLNQRLQAIYTFVSEEAKLMTKKYKGTVYLNRRIIY